MIDGAVQYVTHRTSPKINSIRLHITLQLLLFKNIITLTSLRRQQIALTITVKGSTLRGETRGAFHGIPIEGGDVARFAVGFA
jgi:hypothetical protein